MDVLNTKRFINYSLYISEHKIHDADPQKEKAISISPLFGYELEPL